MKNKITIYLFLSILLCLVFTACDKEQTEPDPNGNKPTFFTEIAVVLPMDDLHKSDWEAAEELLLNSILKGQTKAGADTIISPQFTFYDENQEDLDALSERLASDDNVKMIIGPFYNEHVLTFTQKCSRRQKPVIAPFCTATEICRMNSSKGFFWSLCESDVTQLRLMMAEGALFMKDGKNMGLIASSGATGATYLNWIGYEASELNVSLGDIYQYSPQATDAEIEETFVKALQDTTISVLLCAPASEEEAMLMLSANEKYGHAGSPKLMFSGWAYSLQIKKLDYQQHLDNVYGISPTADPARGFELFVYTSDIRNSNQTSLVYDAMEIASLASINHYYCNGKLTYAESVADIVASKNADGSERQEISGWDRYDIIDIVDQLINHNVKYNITGASGSINFDPDIQSSSTRTIYAFWHLDHIVDAFDDYSSYFEKIDNVTKDGTSRTASNTVNWEQASRMFKKVDGQAVTYDTPVTNQWALLVSGSSDWDNYRHTADVLEMYRLLIKNHYDPSHIIVVAQHDFTQNSKNPYPGEIRNWKGECIYREGDYSVDYQLAELKGPQDVLRILNGDSDNGRLKRVMDTDDGSNVLVYWSGHGNPGYFVWGKSGTGLTRNMLKEFFAKYEQDRKYRKMLWITEPCYSGSVGEAVNDSKAKHLLFITSANSQEISKTICFDNTYNTMMADLFTKNVISLMEENPDITYGTLYEQLVSKTWGSHPQIYGADTFDKLYSSCPKEFFDFNQ